MRIIIMFFFIFLSLVVLLFVLILDQIRNLDKKFVIFENNLDTKLDSKLDKRFVNFEKKIDDKLDERFVNFEKKIDEKFDQKFEYFDGLINSSKKSQELARLCAVAITIGPKSDLGNDNKACGSLVNINNKKYVLTNRHVVIDHKKQKPECARQIPSVTRVFDNHPVPIIRDETLYAKNIDLAIFPVDENSLNNESSSYQWTFCNVTTENSLPALHDELFGIWSRPKGEVRAVYGRVLASSISESLVYGDFQGFSGTGYFLNSKLVAVHKGLKAQDEVFFQHDLPLIDKEFTRNFTNVIKNGKEASDDDISNVADTILDLIEVHGQTPESEAVRAFHVHTDVKLSLSDLEPCDTGITQKESRP